jgi:adenosylcobinamide-phosphate synthase
VISLDHVWILPLALILDWLVGDPDAVWRRIPHPVAIIGGFIGWLERVFNRDDFSSAQRQVLGALSLAVVVLFTAAVGAALERLLAAVAYGWIGTVIVAAVMLAGRSLYDHAAAVGSAFADGIGAARTAVARIVGRDPGSLDGPRVARAAIESTAENFCDGVVAPAIWFLVLGLPGLFAYKAVNTADSVVGHLTARFTDFGSAAARVDDLANLPASRIAGALIALAAPLGGGSIAAAFRTMRTDAPKHRSPNAGWSEAAMAGALGIALAGPRRYAGIIVNDPYLNDGGRRDVGPADIGRALRIYLGANGFLFVVVALPALAFLI